MKTSQVATVVADAQSVDDAIQSRFSCRAFHREREVPRALIGTDARQRDGDLRVEVVLLGEPAESGDVVDQPCHHAATPCARLRLAVHHDARIDAADIDADESRFQVNGPGRHQAAGPQDDDGKNRLLSIDRNAERAIVKRLQDVAGSVLGSLRKDQYRDSGPQKRFQPVNTFLSAVWTRPVNNDRGALCDASRGPNTTVFG